MFMNSVFTLLTSARSTALSSLSSCSRSAIRGDTCQANKQTHVSHRPMRCRPSASTLNADRHEVSRPVSKSTCPRLELAIVANDAPTRGTSRPHSSSCRRSESPCAARPNLCSRHNAAATTQKTSISGCDLTLILSRDSPTDPLLTHCSSNGRIGQAVKHRAEPAPYSYSMASSALLMALPVPHSWYPR
jgi:hypothetical protein